MVITNKITIEVTQREREKNQNLSIHKQQQQNQQNPKEGSKEKKRDKRLQDKQKTVNNMTIVNPFLSIMTLNVN